VFAALAGAAACAPVQAAAPRPSPLDIPAPPPRVVVPPSADVGDPPPPPPATPVPTAPTRPRDAAAPPARVPDKPPAVTPPTTTAPPPPEASTPPLETTSDVKTLENQTNTLLANAQKDLSRVDFKTLSSDARAQYQLAEGFVKQAQTALHEKNFTYARTLAEKAAALASQLPKTRANLPTAP
jgi:hypothetical protein